MEKVNKRVIYEYMLLSGAINNEIEMMSNDKPYVQYHENLKDTYISLFGKLKEILGVSIDRSIDQDTISQISSIQLSAEQRGKIAELRKNPIFVKLMGETALSQRQELEMY